MSAQQQVAASEEVSADAVSVLQQTLRREVNEQIRRLGRGAAGEEQGAIEVVCECGYAGCTGRVEMTVSDYEALRRFPTRFLVKAGHEVSYDERVVSESDTYVAVEKIGRAGIHAVRVDPRRRPARLAGGQTS